MKRKNVLLIISHDLGQHIGPYGVETVQTPNLDRMAAEGTLFEHNYCVSPGCSPSRAAIMTGRYPHSNGVMGLTHNDFLWRLNDDEKHLAAIFAENGYDTCLIGNWHENNRIDNVGYQTVVARSGNSFSLSKNLDDNAWVTPGSDSAQRADYYLSRMKDSEKPFFLYTGFFEPHRPFDFDDAEPDTEKGVWIPPYIPQETDAQKAAAEKEFSEVQGAIKKLDDAIGTIMQSLERNGLKDDTLLVFTADHGLAMPRAKCSLYDPGIETPLILWGGGAPAGVRRTELISNVDYYPTLMEYTGLPIPGNVQGKSFYPLLSCMAATVDEGDLAAEAERSSTVSALQTKYEPRTEIFAEKTYHRDYDPIRCIRTERYKYIINFELNTLYDAPSDIQKGAIFRTSVEQYMPERPRVELYDLETDPWEQNNLSGTSDLAGEELQLKWQLLAWMEETNDPLLIGPVPSIYGREILNDLNACGGK